jgi:hypothetical protein
MLCGDVEMKWLVHYCVLHNHSIISQVDLATLRKGPRAHPALRWPKMSATLLLAFAERAADAVTPPQATLLEASRDVVFRTLGCHIFAYASPETLQLLPQVSKAFLHAAKYRLSQLISKVRPLLMPPFNLTPTDLFKSRGPLHLSESLYRRMPGVTAYYLSAFAEACASGALTRLEWLGLGSNQIGDVGMCAFAEACARGALAKLTTLHLDLNRIGDAGLASFAEACASGALPQLQVLSLYDNQIGDVGISAFAKACASGALPLLKELDVSGNKIGDAGLSSFSSALADGALASLETLYVDDYPIGGECPSLRATCEAREIELS